MRTFAYCAVWIVLSTMAAWAKPNVLWVVVDGAGARAMELPAMRQLAERGVVFTEAYPAGMGSNASRTSMLTGLLPSATGVWEDGDDPRRSVALEGLPTAPEHFRKMGWRVAGGGKIFHATAGGPSQRLTGWGGGRRGYEVDSAWDERFPAVGVQLPLEPLEPEPTFAAGREVRAGDEVLPLEVGAHQVAGWAVAQLAKSAGKKPAVLMVGLSAPEVGKEAEEVLDEALEAIWRGLESGPWREKTLVLVSGDRDAAMESGGEAGRVPLVVVAPGRGSEGGSCAAAVSLIDLYPTVLDWLELRRPDEVQGRSLLPLVKAPDGGGDRVAVTLSGSLASPLMTARTGSAVLVRQPSGEEERLGQGDFEALSAALPSELNLYARPAVEWVGPLREEGGFDLALQMGDRVGAGDLPSAKGCSLLVEARFDYDPSMNANATLVTHGTVALGYALHFVEGKATMTVFHEGAWTSVSTHALEKGRYHLRAAVDGGGIVSIAIPESSEMLAEAPFPDGFPADLAGGLRTDAGTDLLRPGWFPGASVFEGPIERLRLSFLTVLPVGATEVEAREPVPLRAIPVE